MLNDTSKATKDPIHGHVDVSYSPLLFEILLPVPYHYFLNSSLLYF